MRSADGIRHREEGESPGVESGEQVEVGNPPRPENAFPGIGADVEDGVPPKVLLDQFDLGKIVPENVNLPMQSSPLPESDPSGPTFRTRLRIS